MDNEEQRTIILNNGVEMPQIGFGVWKCSPEEARMSVKTAIECGYTLIDAAKQYGNESGVGQGIYEGLRSTGLKRESLFITSKVFNAEQGYESTINNFNGTLERLQLDYLDMYLIHWPVTDKYLDTWRALELLYKQNKVRAIGVSNFDIKTLDNLLRHASIMPAIDQVEFNPLFQQPELKKYLENKNIFLEAWSPLGGGQALNNPILKNLAKKYDRTVAQVILKWELQLGLIAIPKSINKERIYNNINIFDFSLSNEDVGLINSINTEQRTGPWLNNFNWYDPENGSPDIIQNW